MNSTVLITNGNTLSMLSLGDWIRRFGEGCLRAIFITERLPSSKSNARRMANLFVTSGFHYAYFKLWSNRVLPVILRGRGLPATVGALCAHYGITPDIHRVSDINRPDIVAKIASYDPELVLSFSATQRFVDDILEIPSRAAINAHYALLPEYAGLSPYFWYLNNEEERCGSTLHLMVTRLDAGPVIEQVSFPMDGLRTVLSVAIKQTQTISPMLSAFYSGRTSEDDAVRQDLSQRSYYGHPLKDTVRTFMERGYRFHADRDVETAIGAARALVQPAS